MKVAQLNNFLEFEFTTPYHPGTLLFNYITASNLNADEEATYSLFFTP
jgi:hypothetical protein